MSYRKKYENWDTSNNNYRNCPNIEQFGGRGGVRGGSASKRSGWNGNSVDPDQTAPRAV